MRIDIVYTCNHPPRMTRRRSGFSEEAEAATLGTAERRQPGDVKGSINLRVEATTRQMIDDAAAILGKTRTEFMIDSARREAVDVLLDRRLFVLNPRDYDAFMRALDNPPAPGPKLRSLLRRVPAWKR